METLTLDVVADTFENALMQAYEALSKDSSGVTYRVALRSVEMETGYRRNYFLYIFDAHRIKG